MKAQEIILDILGLALFIFSMYAFFYMGVDFYKCTALGIVGLALFVLKTSKVRGYIESFIKNKLDK
jgi:uncharacterized membrane protein